jgi:predicted MFS family arabinose efflux permease
MATTQAGAYRRIFEIPAFRRFWLGMTVSGLGDAMTRVALTWYVLETTGSAGAVGALLVAFTAPIAVGGFLAGWLLDRFDRRRVMLIDSLLRGGMVGAVPLLHATGQLALWHVYVAAAGYGLLMMISLAGGPTIIPSLVPDDQLATANALEMLSFTAAGVLGPPLAGLLIARFGAPNVLAVDALSYFAFALALVRIGAIPTPERERGRGSFGEAIALLRREPVLLSTTLMFMAFNVGNGALAVWLPIYTARDLAGGASLYGFLLGILAAGEMASALAAGAVRLWVPLGALICAAQAMSGLSLGVVLIGRNAWATATGLLFFGVFSAPLTIWAQTLRMRIIPPELRGRTFALLRTLMQGTNPVGGALAGALLPLVGIPAMIAMTAIFTGAPGLLGARVQALRTAGRPDSRVVLEPDAVAAH